MATAERSRFEVLVLGIAQDGGVPHVGCNKECCERARREGFVLMPACIAVHDRQEGRLLLVEATPRVGSQLTFLHRLTGIQDRGRRPVDAVMITHAHIGHYTGLIQFGKEVAATKNLPVHVSPRMAGFLRTNGPWNQLVEQKQIDIREFKPGEKFEPIPGLKVEAVPVPHRDEYSDTMAFRIFGPNKSVLFAPDVDSWDKQPGLLGDLLEGIDVAFIDGTFYDYKELPERIRRLVMHPPIVDSMQRLEVRGKEAPGSIRFIHMNHTNPALSDPNTRRAMWKRGFRIARQGERLDI